MQGFCTICLKTSHYVFIIAFLTFSLNGFGIGFDQSQSVDSLMTVLIEKVGPYLAIIALIVYLDWKNRQTMIRQNEALIKWFRRMISRSIHHHQTRKKEDKTT